MRKLMVDNKIISCKTVLPLKETNGKLVVLVLPNWSIQDILKMDVSLNVKFHFDHFNSKF